MYCSLDASTGDSIVWKVSVLPYNYDVIQSIALSHQFDTAAQNVSCHFDNAVTVCWGKSLLFMKLGVEKAVSVRF